MAQEDEMEQAPQEAEDAPEEGRGTRIAGTAIVAVGSVALIFAGAAAAFFLLAELLQGQWISCIIAVVALAAVVWLLNRLIRVAANQNKDPMGKR